MALRKIKIIPYQRFASLTVVKETESITINKSKKRMVLCKCECDQEVSVRLEYLRSGHTKSCGCAIVKELVKHRKTHGLSGTRLHGIWNGMKNRCLNPKVKSFKYYGSKGVKVCKEWMDFQPFCEWALANGYKENLTIERKNPFGNYEPSNCEWIPQSEQAKNKRSNTKFMVPND